MTIKSTTKNNVQLERILKNNLVSAYLDYVEEFGRDKANEVCREVCKSLREIKEEIHR